MRPAFAVKLPAKLEFLEELIDVAANYARKMSFTDGRIGEIRVAVEEALVNVMKYAYGNSGGDVEITCGTEDGKSIIIEIIDGGIPFNPLSLKEPDTTLGISERKIGGLGILLIKKLINEVRYNRVNNKNRLTFIVLKQKEDA